MISLRYFQKSHLLFYGTVNDIFSKVNKRLYDFFRYIFLFNNHERLLLEGKRKVQECEKSKKDFL